MAIRERRRCFNVLIANNLMISAKIVPSCIKNKCEGALLGLTSNLSENKEVNDEISLSVTTTI